MTMNETDTLMRHDRADDEALGVCEECGELIFPHPTRIETYEREQGGVVCYDCKVKHGYVACDECDQHTKKPEVREGINMCAPCAKDWDSICASAHPKPRSLREIIDSISRTAAELQRNCEALSETAQKLCDAETKPSPVADLVRDVAFAPAKAQELMQRTHAEILAREKTEFTGIGDAPKKRGGE